MQPTVLRCPIVGLFALLPGSGVIVVTSKRAFHTTPSTLGGVANRRQNFFFAIFYIFNTFVVRFFPFYFFISDAIKTNIQIYHVLA